MLKSLQIYLLLTLGIYRIPGHEAIASNTYKRGIRCGSDRYAGRNGPTPFSSSGIYCTWLYFWL